MRKAEIYVNDKLAGILSEIERGHQYRFEYQENYAGPSVSLTLPTAQGRHDFDRFPPFFDGLLPEGTGLEALLKLAKIDRNDSCVFQHVAACLDQCLHGVGVLDAHCHGISHRAERQRSHRPCPRPPPLAQPPVSAAPLDADRSIGLRVG